MRTIVAVFAVLLVFPAWAGSAERVVVTLEGREKGFEVLIDSRKQSDVLLALSRLHSQSPERTVFLLVHEDASIARINNLLGIMLKAEMVPSKIFTFSRPRETMRQLALGCDYLYSADVSQLTLARGLKACQ